MIALPLLSVRTFVTCAILTFGMALRAEINARPAPLVWDAMEKSYAARPGDSLAEVRFVARNPGASEVIVERIEPTCGCTVAEVTTQPWRIPARSADTLRLKIDLIGKSGDFVKTVVLTSTAGEQTLTIKLHVPGLTPEQRAENAARSQHDRQAVFAGDCARCHATPAVGKEGADLFRSACAICHVTEHRASSVPDLARPTTRRDPGFWRNLIADGRPGTTMPAFARSHGGPLSEKQIASLVDFLMQNFPVEPLAANAE